jgi:hypothetical protein
MVGAEALMALALERWIRVGVRAGFSFTQC